MPRYDVTLLTESRYEQPRTINWYVEQILTEDRLVQEALSDLGLRCRRVDWARPDVDWSDTRYALFRTTWNYFDYYKDWQRWLQQTARQTRFINSYAHAQWNMDKRYLADLADRGVHIPATRFIEAGTAIELEKLFHESGWPEAVLKPAVSGAGRHTYRLSAANVHEYAEIFAQLLQREALLLQEFQQQVVDFGELSLMVIDGEVTHAVRKIARPGEFRVQDDFGGTVQAYEPLAAEVKFAEHVIAACPDPPLYARVDLIRDNADRLALAELELMEPEMWFRHNPAAARRLATAIKRQYF